MAYTVRRVSGLSGVSIRTLHFYDEIGLLKPAYVNGNGYRYYEEPQLLKLQQILFYRELGLELSEIKSILGRADFEKAAALKAHRAVLEQQLARTQALISTINKTIDHVKGTKKMSSEEMFDGFKVAAGASRSNEPVELRGEPTDCKVSGQDTNGEMCIFEFTGLSSGPRRRHCEQDEWIYVIEGELQFAVGENQFHAGPGESVFVPRQTPYAWASANGQLARIVDLYQPAGRMEEFFRELSKHNSGPPVHEALSIDEFRRLFQEHGMELVGPPLVGEWQIADGRIVQVRP
ncbi:MerR family transcriptional regulator [Occallatibacter savannae]|uniref:MerR family transcriptional regulator n=1 Tax=Occallatibacter savannae TaxID=1002691 RepID=UPI000D695AF4|nr:MerR family transcriptional regulator [Occallatibacter savannae]